MDWVVLVIWGNKEKYLGSAEKVGSATYLKPTRCRCILILQIAGGFKEVVLPAN
jgi:hypothetical protein